MHIAHYNTCGHYYYVIMFRKDWLAVLWNVCWYFGYLVSNSVHVKVFVLANNPSEFTSPTILLKTPTMLLSVACLQFHYYYVFVHKNVFIFQSFSFRSFTMSWVWVDRVKKMSIYSAYIQISFEKTWTHISFQLWNIHFYL